LGKRLIEELQALSVQDHELIALGTNHAAAVAMSKAGARLVWVGETAISRMVLAADVILAPLNTVIPGSMLGEITPGIAEAIRQAPGHKLLVPINSAKFEVVGVESRRLEDVIRRAIDRVQVLMKSDRVSAPEPRNPHLQNSQTTRV
jgi:hypothetical protein